MEKCNDSLDIIIKKDSYLKGMINTPNSIKISGFFQGKIFSKGTVFIDTTGDIDGDIEAENVIICGNVKGNIIAKTKIHLTSTSKLYGHIVSTNIVIDKDAFFLGDCKLSKNKALS